MPPRTTHKLAHGITERRDLPTILRDSSAALRIERRRLARGLDQIAGSPKSRSGLPSQAQLRFWMKASMRRKWDKSTAYEILSICRSCNAIDGAQEHEDPLSARRMLHPRAEVERHIPFYGDEKPPPVAKYSVPAGITHPQIRQYQCRSITSRYCRACDCSR